MESLETRNDRIIDELVRQLGGNRFLAMTGSKPLYKETGCINPKIWFKLARNSSPANRLQITYETGPDTYKMRFVKIRQGGSQTLKVFDLVYSDQLQKIFTSFTGLETSL